MFLVIFNFSRDIFKNSLPQKKIFLKLIILSVRAPYIRVRYTYTLVLYLWNMYFSKERIVFDDFSVKINFSTSPLDVRYFYVSVLKK